MKTCIQIRNPRNREDCLAVVQLTAKNFAAEVRGAGQTEEQYIDIETHELYSNTELWSQIGTRQCLSSSSTVVVGLLPDRRTCLDNCLAKSP